MIALITLMILILFGPLEWLAAKIGIDIGIWAVGGMAGVVIAWILKRIPNDKIRTWVSVFMYGAGATVTAGLAKWKYTKRIWNKYIEPWVIDAIDNIIVHGIAEFIRGMRSDNA